MQQVTRGRSKMLLPVYDRTLAAQACRWLVDSGVRRIVVVTAPADFDDLYPHLAEFFELGQLKFVFQPKPTGTADALFLALPYLLSDQLLCLFADNVFECTLSGEAVARLTSGHDLRTFAIWTSEGLGELAVIQPDSTPARLVRKPHDIEQGLALTGLFLVRVVAFEQFHAQTVATEGERDLLDFVDDALTRGVAQVERLQQRWVDAASSFEALWRAGSLVRDTERAVDAEGA